MTATDDFLAANQAYAENFNHGDKPMPPARKTAVVACMDARIETGRLLGLEEGDAHVIRNAGGVVSDDVIRSLAISQRLLGTTEIVLIHHTDCGMLTFKDEDVKAQIEKETGVRPPFALEPELLQSAWFRPHNRSEELDGLYLVGAGTHPGAGMPGVLCSAKVMEKVVPPAAELGAGRRSAVP